MRKKATNVAPYHKRRPRFFLYIFVLYINPSLVLFAMGVTLMVVADKVTTDITSIYLLFLTLDKMKLWFIYRSSLWLSSQYQWK